MATQAPRRNDLFAQLARQSTGGKVAILVLAMLLLGALYWQFFYKDLVSELDAAKKTGDGLQVSQRDLDKRIDALEALQKKICGGRPDCVVENQLRTDLQEVSRALPAEPERNAFLSTLQLKADDAGVTFKGWSHLAEAPVDKYLKVPIAVEVEGTFYQLLNYFSLLAPPPVDPAAPAAPAAPGKLDPGKRKWDRIISVENLSVAQSAVRNDEIVLLAKFTASAFRQEEDKKAAPPAAAQPPAGKPAGTAAPAKPPSLMGGQNRLDEEKAKNPHLFE